MTSFVKLRYLKYIILFEFERNRNSKKRKGHTRSFKGEYIQGCDAVISRLEKRGGGGCQIDFSPLRGRMRNVSQGKQAEREKGRRSGFNILIKATRGFVAARRRWTFQARINGRPSPHQPPTLATSLVTPREHHHPSVEGRRSLPSVFQSHVDFSLPSWLLLSSLGPEVVFVWLRKRDDGNFN